MLASDIVRLTRRRIAELLAGRKPLEGSYRHQERRRTPRWPFPGAVELRPTNGERNEIHFGTCRDFSASGVGVTCEHPFEPGTPLEISIHLPEASLWGRAIVCHCREVNSEGLDQFFVGLEFEFDD